MEAFFIKEGAGMQKHLKKEAGSGSKLRSD